VTNTHHCLDSHTTCGFSFTSPLLPDGLVTCKRRPPLLDLLVLGLSPCLLQLTLSRNQQCLNVRHAMALGSVSFTHQLCSHGRDLLVSIGDPRTGVIMYLTVNSREVCTSEKYVMTSYTTVAMSALLSSVALTSPDKGYWCRRASKQSADSEAEKRKGGYRS
jgi:hypothetical protein